MKTYLAVVIVGLGLVMAGCAAPGISAAPSAVPSASATGIPPPAVAECSPSHPMPSGEIVQLYLPCGAPAELSPVDRAISSSGEEAIAEVLDLLLAGPTALERQAGFSSLLSPGDVTLIDVADGRLILDFPAEVNTVSTSAGSAAVLGSLRMTLLALDDVHEIELRLRNDCATFFEWIQVGPTCHLLTDDGIIAAPLPSPSTAAGIPTIPGAPTGPDITTGSPVQSEDSDGIFRLTLEAGQERYRAGQPIDAAATLTFLGPDASTEAMGAGTGLIGFGVESEDPAIAIGPAFTSDCAPWPFVRGEIVDYPFQKSGGYGENEPLAPFYRSYFASPELRLPAGTWRIFSGGSFYSGGQCGQGFSLHNLTVSVTVIVEP